MRTPFVAISLVAALFALSSCSTTKHVVTDGDKLTREEYQELVARCRKKAMLAPPSKKGPLTSEEKRFIQTSKPKFSVHYIGYKRGKYRMWWKLSDYHIVKVVGKGDLLSPKCPTFVVTIFTR
jgi:hypothetical protein